MGRRLRRGTDGGSRPSPNGSAPTTVVGSGATSSPGVAVAALIVPKNLGYAGIAGIPLQNGLMRLPPARSCMRSLGPAGRSRPGRARDWRPWPRAPSRWPGSAGSRMRPPSSPGSRWCRACCTWFLVLAVFKMGWIAQFLSRAVVTGFLFGAAIDVVIGELSQAHRDRGQRLEPAAGAVVLARDAGRCPAGDRRRTRRGACRIN
jgi:hypothetical protein